MPFHHVALATRDVKATHEFYTGPMGFTLAKVDVGRTPEGGWAKHLFYETGGGELIAFWDLHDDTIPADFRASISEGLGLPLWTNHIAFAARGLEDLTAHRARLLEHGVTVLEVDHGWCHSIYATDPNGILVEFCTMKRELGPEDREEAERLLADPSPEPHPGAQTVVHRPPPRD
jgi:catechol 2,3-dioxygenase-like lactoylglutathione lyase family enzyme